MPRALILAGTGAIGRATARRLLAAGWTVEVTGRNPDHLPADLAAAGVTFTPVDRDTPDAGAQLTTVLGVGRICWWTAAATPRRTPAGCWRSPAGSAPR